MSGPEADPDYALDLAASELRADRQDTGVMLEALATRLESALPALVDVQRRKVGGWRSKRSELSRMTVTVGESRHELVREPHGFSCTRHRVVRGITLKREQISMSEWISEVVAAVCELAEVGEQDRRALAALLA